MPRCQLGPVSPAIVTRSLRVPETLLHDPLTSFGLSIAFHKLVGGAGRPFRTARSVIDICAILLHDSQFWMPSFPQ
jgi:hypothetical protein